MADSTTMSPTLLLIFKEYSGKYHLLNSPGLPVKTVAPLINATNTSPFVDTALLMSVTDVLTDARFSGYSYMSSFYASKPAHVYVLLEKHDAIEDDYETIARPLPKIPEPSAAVQADPDVDIDVNAQSTPFPDWDSASWFPGDDAKFHVAPTAAANGIYETYPGGHFYKYISLSGHKNDTSASGQQQQQQQQQQQNSTASSHTIGLSKSAGDWDAADAEWDTNMADSVHDEWCDARADDVVSVASTEPYEDGFYEAYYGKRAAAAGSVAAADDATPETESVPTPKAGEWRPVEAVVQSDKRAKSTRW